MKNKIIQVLALLLGIYTVQGQKLLRHLPAEDTLRVSDIKTTHLLFRDALSYVDIGSPYFVADTTQQMVRLKHIGEGMDDVKGTFSNLTVVTHDGGFYSMILEYDRFAPKVSYEVLKSNEYVPSFQRAEIDLEKKERYFRTICDRIAVLDARTLIRNKRNEDLDIQVSGLYYIDEKLVVRIRVLNGSGIDFDIDQILCRIKLTKRTSPDYLYQERLVEPIFSCSDDMEVPGNGYLDITMIFKKFMPNENERLFFDVLEQNGGRAASILIPRRKLMNPIILD